MMNYLRKLYDDGCLYEHAYKKAYTVNMVFNDTLCAH